MSFVSVIQSFTAGRIRNLLLLQQPPCLRMVSTRNRFAKMCMNCWNAGHWAEQCTEPIVCHACGMEGHRRVDCLNPDHELLDALRNGPKICFRCGFEGHVAKECPMPQRCYTCGQYGHLKRDCPESLPD